MLCYASHKEEDLVHPTAMSNAFRFVSNYLQGQAGLKVLDVGGAADSKRVAEAFKIILSDKAVEAVLINIFGGIVRCDVIADGIIKAVEEIGVNVPVVVRLEGNNAELGSQKLSQSGLNIISASGLEEAAKLVVGSVS